MVSPRFVRGEPWRCDLVVVTLSLAATGTRLPRSAGLSAHTGYRCGDDRLFTRVPEILPVMARSLPICCNRSASAGRPLVATKFDPCQAMRGCLVQIGRPHRSILSQEDIMRELILACMISALILGTALWIG